MYGFESVQEYQLEGIDWKKVELADNQGCLNLFEKFNNEKAAFKVRHYAREVQYETTGFVKKTRDTLQPDTIMFLSSLALVVVLGMLNYARRF